ncbi:YfcL family protein [Colwellia sp. 20A7]|uniref:YfcL family protein n=1 Tax=Colwellia sp. 20A7 TaxID=2689569 RepID=UPI001359DEB2|nr:YfcL family protein [Colwellia sp. 20A7]
MIQKINTLNDLYQYLDNLFDQDVDSDTLFAGGYLRGFVSLAATESGDEQQTMSVALVDNVSQRLANAKSELSPQDNAIVQNFWSVVQGLM